MTRVIPALLLVPFLAPFLGVASCRPAAVEVDAPVISGDSENADAHYEQALARIGDIDKGLPRVEDGFVWWGLRDDDGRTEHLRRGLAPGAPVEVVLDEARELRSSENFVDVGSLSASPDGKQVAFSADVTRSDRYGVHVKDLRSGRIHDVVDDADFSVAWSKDGNLYFTRFGGDDRPRSLWRLQVDHDVTPTLVHELPANDPGEVLVADVDGQPELFVKDAADVAAYRLGSGASGEGASSGTLRWSRPSVR